jgi:hypothetical protein
VILRVKFSHTHHLHAQFIVTADAGRRRWLPTQTDYKVAWYYATQPSGSGFSSYNAETGSGVSRLPPLSVSAPVASEEEGTVSILYNTVLSNSMEQALPTLIDKPTVPSCGLESWEASQKSGRLEPGHLGWSNLEYPAVPLGMELRPINVNEQRQVDSHDH